jgi:hypothetical protein
LFIISRFHRAFHLAVSLFTLSRQNKGKNFLIFFLVLDIATTAHEQNQKAEKERPALFLVQPLFLPTF